MGNIMAKIQNNKKMKLAIKIFFLIIISFFIFNVVKENDIKKYFTTKEISYKNENSSDYASSESITEITQSFVAKGNLLKNIELYLKNTDSIINIAITNSNNDILYEDEIDLNDNYIPNGWNTINIDCENLKLNNTYQIKVSSKSSLQENIGLSTSSSTENLQNEKLNENLLIGFNFSYSYLTLRKFFRVFL